MQAQSMMGAHANSMVGQTPSQNQFMNQTPFPNSAAAVNVNLTQQAGQTGVTQVRTSNTGFDKLSNPNTGTEKCSGGSRFSSIRSG